MARSDDPRGTYLPTGWRVVGARADRILEKAAAAAVQRLEPGRVEDTLYALQCTLPTAVSGRPTVERVLDAVTGEIRQGWEDCPRLVRDEEVERPPSRFGGLRYTATSEPGERWLGEIVWRAVHPVVAGAATTTRLLVEERSHFTRLGLRVTADEGPTSVRGYVGAGQAQPAFLRALRGVVDIHWMGSPLGPEVIGPGGMRDFVDSTLSSPTRNVPVAVLSPLEDGGYVVDPDDLAWDLLGRARLYVIAEYRQTFELSDLAGDKRMSCYHGATRCYLPGWTRHDNPYEHPLLLGERLADPVLRATWLGEVGRWLGQRTELPPTPEERRAGAERDATPEQPSGDATAAPPSDAPPARAAEGEGEGTTSAEVVEDGSRGAADGTEAPAAPAPRLAAAPGPDPAAHSLDPELRSLFHELIQEVQGLGSMVGELTDEVERLRTISAVRASSTNAIERRLGRLEDILEQVFPDGTMVGSPGGDEERADAPDEAEADEGRTSLVDVVRDAAESHSDALVFLDSAYRAAEDSPYEDPERVRAILEAMARVARRRRDGVLGTSLREAFGDLGIDYRSAIARSTSERLREQYRFLREDGERVEAEEHIVLGNTYDPRRCLRIYFSSRVPNEPRFVIGHVGRHFEVKSSS